MLKSKTTTEPDDHFDQSSEGDYEVLPDRDYQTALAVEFRELRKKMNLQNIDQEEK